MSIENNDISSLLNNNTNNISDDENILNNNSDYNTSPRTKKYNKTDYYSNPKYHNFAPEGRTPYVGEYSLSSQYDKGISSGMNQERYRGRQQGTADEFGNALARTITTIVGETIQGIAAPLALGTSVAQEISGGNATFNDPLGITDLGESVSNWGNDNFKIYRSGDNYSRNWHEYIADNIPQLGSSVASFMVGAGYTKFASMGIKAMANASKISKFNKFANAVRQTKYIDDILKATPTLTQRGKDVSKALGASIVMRNMENMMEARGVKKNLHNDLMNTFRNESEFMKALNSEGGKEYVEDAQRNGNEISEQGLADFVSSKAAWQDYGTNYTNLMFDFVQVLPFYKTTVKTRGNAKNYNILKAEAPAKGLTIPKKTFNNYALPVIKNAGSQIALQSTEGFEEIINGISEKEGMYYGKNLLNLTKDKSFLNRLGEYLTDPQIWEQGLWGMLGGTVFQGISSGVKKLDKNYESDNKQRIDEINGRKLQLSMINAQLKSVKEAPENNENGIDIQNEFDKIKSKSMYDMGLRASRVGNVDSLVDWLQSPELKKSAVELGLTTEEDADKYVSNSIQDVLNAEKFYTEAKRNLIKKGTNSDINEILTSIYVNDRGTTEKLKKDNDKLKLKISQAKSENTFISDVLPTLPNSSDILNDYNHLVNEKVVDNIKREIDYYKKEKGIDPKFVEYLENIHKDLTSKVKESRDSFKSSPELNNIHDSFIEAEAHSKLQDYLITGKLIQDVEILNSGKEVETKLKEAKNANLESLISEETKYIQSLPKDNNARMLGITTRINDIKADKNLTDLQKNHVIKYLEDIKKDIVVDNSQNTKTIDTDANFNESLSKMDNLERQINNIDPNVHSVQTLDNSVALNRNVFTDGKFEKSIAKIETDIKNGKYTPEQGKQLIDKYTQLRNKLQQLEDKLFENKHLYVNPPVTPVETIEPTIEDETEISNINTTVNTIENNNNSETVEYKESETIVIEDNTENTFENAIISNNSISTYIPDIKNKLTENNDGTFSIDKESGELMKVIHQLQSKSENNEGTKVTYEIEVGTKYLQEILEKHKDDPNNLIGSLPIAKYVEINGVKTKIGYINNVEYITKDNKQIPTKIHNGLVYNTPNSWTNRIINNPLLLNNILNDNNGEFINLLKDLQNNRNARNVNTLNNIVRDFNIKTNNQFVDILNTLTNNADIDNIGDSMLHISNVILYGKNTNESNDKIQLSEAEILDNIKRWNDIMVNDIIASDDIRSNITNEDVENVKNNIVPNFKLEGNVTSVKYGNIVNTDVEINPFTINDNNSIFVVDSKNNTLYSKVEDVNSKVVVPKSKENKNDKVSTFITFIKRPDGKQIPIPIKTKVSGNLNDNIKKDINNVLNTLFENLKSSNNIKDLYNSKYKEFTLLEALNNYFNVDSNNKDQVGIKVFINPTSKGVVKSIILTTKDYKTNKESKYQLQYHNNKFTLQEISIDKDGKTQYTNIDKEDILKEFKSKFANLHVNINYKSYNTNPEYRKLVNDNFVYTNVSKIIDENGESLGSFKHGKDTKGETPITIFTNYKKVNKVNEELDSIIENKKEVITDKQIETKEDKIKDIERRRQEELNNIGQKQLTYTFNILTEAETPKQSAKVITKIEQNISQGAKLSSKQSKQLSDAKNQLKNDGYEIIKTSTYKDGDRMIVKSSKLYEGEIFTEQQIKDIENYINNKEKKGLKIEIEYLPSPIINIIEPQLNKDDKMIQAAEVSIIIFDSVEQAKEAIKKSKEAGYEKNKKSNRINAKYDAELTALENIENKKEVIEDKQIELITIDPSEITYTDEEGNPCAVNGLTNAAKGTNWKIVKDFKGQPKHSQGGVDITISNDGVKMRRDGKDIKAKYGLLIINNN